MVHLYRSMIPTAKYPRNAILKDTQTCLVACLQYCSQCERMSYFDSVFVSLSEMQSCSSGQPEEQVAATYPHPATRRRVIVLMLVFLTSSGSFVNGNTINKVPGWYVTYAFVVAIAIRLLTTHPYRDGAPFLLLQDTHPTFRCSSLLRYNANHSRQKGCWSS